MRKIVNIKLSLLEADVILQQLNRNLDGIAMLEEKRGFITPAEQRLFKAVEEVSKQVVLTPLEERQIDATIQAHEDMHNKPRQN